MVSKRIEEGRDSINEFIQGLEWDRSFISDVYGQGIDQRDMSDH